MAYHRGICSLCSSEGYYHAVHDRHVNGGKMYVPLCRDCWKRLPATVRKTLREQYEPFPTVTGHAFLKWIEKVTFDRFPSGNGIVAIKRRLNDICDLFGWTPELLPDKYFKKEEVKRRQRELIRSIKASANCELDPKEIVQRFSMDSTLKLCICCLSDIDVVYDQHGCSWCGLCLVLSARYGYCPLHIGPVIDLEQMRFMKEHEPFDPTDIDPDLVPPSMLERYGIRPDGTIKRKRGRPVKTGNELLPQYESFSAMVNANPVAEEGSSEESPSEENTADVHKPMIRLKKFLTCMKAAK